MNELKYFVKKGPPLSIDRGWGNGYVCLPPGHPCHGMDYNEIHEKYEIEVHGGLTFSQHAEDWPESPGKEYWIVGFDTAHWRDTIDKWPKEKVEVETIELMRQLSLII